MPLPERSGATRPEIVVAPAEHGDRQYLQLSVLYHPDIDRIGECADLGKLANGKPLALSRLRCDFRKLRSGARARPLEDPWLSRKPLTLRRGDGGVHLSVAAGGSSLLVGETEVPDTLHLSDSWLQTGAVLVLARRIVLLLHYAEPWQYQDDCALVGESDGLQRVRELICNVAATDAPVLILGESGTGKELVATALHERSERSGEALVALNMGAVPV